MAEENEADVTDVTTDTTEETTTEETGTVESKGGEEPANTTDTNETEVTEETESTDKTETKTETTDDTPVEENVRVVPEVTDYVLPEGVPPQMAQFAKDNDFTQDQLDGALKEFGGYMNASKNAEQALMKKAGNAHTEAWGESKDYNLSLVRRALKQNDPEGKLTEMLNTSGYGNHPAVIDFFLSIGKSMREGGFIKGAVNRPVGKSTAASSMFGKTHPSAQ